MTVSTASSRVVYIGNGSTTVFPFAFKVAKACELVVVYTDADGVDHALSSGDYTATGFNQDAGGTVTYPLSGGPIAVGTRLTIYRDVPLTQPTQVSNQGAMWPQAIEGALDRLTWQTQKLQDQVDRSVRASPNEPSALSPLPKLATRKNKLVGFDGDGQPTVVAYGDVGGIADASVVEYTPSWGGAITRSVRDRLMDQIDIRDFGAVGDNATDNTQAFRDACDAAQEIAEALGVDEDSAFAALEIKLPSGRFRTGPVDVGNVRFTGVGWQGTRIVGRDAQQSHLFRSVIAGADVSFANLELMGWAANRTPADYPNNLIVLQDGTLTVDNCRLNHANGLVWVQRGSDTSLSNVKMGFFPSYALKFGGIDNGTATTRAITAASWANGVRTLTIDGGAPDLQAFDTINTIAGMGNGLWNGEKVQLIKGTSGNTIKIASPVDPGPAGALGTIQYSKSNGAAVSEVRLEKLKMYSGANSMYGIGSSDPDPSKAEFTGRQIILDSECGAVELYFSDGGSTAIGVEVIDSLQLGNRRTCGFLHVEEYTGGKCEKASVWIKANGGNVEIATSRLSAVGDDEAYGMIVDSPNAAVALRECTFQNCNKGGIRLHRFFSLMESGTVYRDIGHGDDPGEGGIALHAVGGTGYVTSSGIVYDQNLQAAHASNLDYAVLCEPDFRGDIHVAASRYRDIAETAFASEIEVGAWVTAQAHQIDDVVMRDDINYICVQEHTSGTFAADLAAGKWEPRKVGLNAYDNDDIVVVPPGSTPAQIREYKARHGVIWITRPFETVFADTIDLSGLTGDIIITWGTSPVIRSDATTVLKIGGRGGGTGNGWKKQDSDINIKGELFITRESAAATGVVGVEVVPDTYDVNIDYLRCDKVGTAIRAPLGPIHGIHIGKLYFYDCVDGGVDFFSSAPDLEIGHVTIDWVDANTSDQQSWGIGLSIGPNVGSGGKTSIIVKGGIIYRYRHALHFWGVQNVISFTYAAGVGAITMAKAHYKAPGDTIVLDGFDQAQGNGSFTLIAGSAGRVFKINMSNPGVSTLTGKGWYSVNAAITQRAGINFDAPRKARINNLTIRGPNGHGIYVEGGADIHISGVTIDDSGIFSVYNANIVGLGYDGDEIVVEVSEPHDCLVNEYFTIKRSQTNGTGTYNGTWLCSGVTSPTILRALASDPGGPVTELGKYYHPEDTVTSNIYVDKFFHGKLTIDAGQIHESNGPGLSWNAIYALGLHMRSVVQWNGSWGATNAAPNAYFAPGHHNVFLEDCAFGLADHWRIAGKTPTFSGLPGNGETLTLNGTVITFVNGAPAAGTLQVQRDGGATLATFIIALAALINTSADAELQKIVAEPLPAALKIMRTRPGSGGNAFTLATTAAAITLGGSALSGGTGAQTATWALEGFIHGIRGNKAINVRGDGINGVYSAAQSPEISTTSQVIAVTDNASPALRVSQYGSAPALLIEDESNPDITPFAILGDGQMLHGYGVQLTLDGAIAPVRQFFGNNTSNSTTGLVNWSSGAVWQKLTFAKSRGSVPTHAIVASASVLGEIGWCGSDGTAFIPGASIRAEVDGTPGTNDMPTKLVFGTTLDGAAIVTDRWQIGNGGMMRALSGSFSRGVPVIKTADFTVATNENWLINNKPGSTCTVTLPSAASFPGRELMLLNYQPQTVISASSNVVPLASGAASTAILAGTPGKWAKLVSDGTNWLLTMAG